MSVINMVESGMLNQLGIEEKHHKLFLSSIVSDIMIGLELYSHRPDFHLIKCYIIDNIGPLYEVEEYRDWWNNGGYKIRDELNDKFGYEH